MENNQVLVNPETLPVNGLKIGESEKADFVVTGERLLSMKMEKIPTLLDPVFPKIGLAALGGASDTGKSTLLRQMAMAIVSGEKDFLGFQINAEHRSVIYVSTEDDEYALSYLLNKQNNARHHDSTFRSLRYIFETEDLLKKLEYILRRQPVDVIFIDTFSDLYDGSLNETNKVRSYLNIFANLAKKYKCLIIFLHHTGKGKEESEPSKNSLLGSQGFEAKMRLVVELRKDWTNPAVRHFCITKGNYLPIAYKEASYVLGFDDQMLFHSLQRRMAFSKLAKPKNPGKDKTEVKERIFQLNAEGMTTRKIADKLKEEGFKIGKSTVANVVAELRPTAQESIEEEDGQDKE